MGRELPIYPALVLDQLLTAEHFRRSVGLVIAEEWQGSVAESGENTASEEEATDGEVAETESTENEPGPSGLVIRWDDRYEVPEALEARFGQLTLRRVVQERLRGSVKLRRIIQKKI